MITWKLKDKKTFYTSEVLDEMVDTFQDSLQDITDRLDKNFQFLTVQLHSEFDSYLQYALGISTGEIDTTLLRHNLENPSTHDYPTIPDLVTSFYQPITQFENFEIKLANEDIQRQLREVVPLTRIDLGCTNPSDVEPEAKILVYAEE